MEAYRQEIIVGAVVIYMIFCVITGLWAMRRTKNSSDFFIAGRGLGPIVVSLALFSSTLSGFGFVGRPGLVYSIGVSSFWMIVISSTGYALGFFLVAKRIRMIADVRNCMVARHARTRQHPQHTLVVNCMRLRSADDHGNHIPPQLPSPAPCPMCATPASAPKLTRATLRRT